jgi:hypothetical protein
MVRLRSAISFRGFNMGDSTTTLRMIDEKEGLSSLLTTFLPRCARGTDECVRPYVG